MNEQPDHKRRWGFAVCSAVHIYRGGEKNSSTQYGTKKMGARG
jgi:hypothetical protein